VPWFVSYAVGALLAGILIFFILEKLVLLRHCHTDECAVHSAAAAHEIPQEVGDVAVLPAAGYSRRRAPGPADHGGHRNHRVI
jgi:zinc transporter ZupT